MPPTPSRLKLIPPKGIDDTLYWRALLAPAALGVSLGIQLTLILIITLGPLPDWPSQDKLTVMGIAAIHPEYDVMAFILGCITVLITIAFSVMLWNRHLHAVQPRDVPHFLGFGYTLQLLAALLSGLAFIASSEIVRRSAFDRWQPNILELMVLLAPAALTVAVIAVHYASGRDTYEKASLPRLFEAGSAASLWISRLVGIGTIFGVAAPVYVPSTSTLAEAVHLFDEYLHWDHFAVGAAWAYSNGMALGTEVYCR